MFFKTIGMASALGFIYAASMSDDEGYKEESDEVRDRNWILPKYVRDTVGIDRIPVAPELAFVFKSIPERMVQQFRDSAKGEAADVSDMVLEYLSDAAFMYGSMPIPTVIKPVLENMTNYSLFTRRSLVPVSMRDLPAGLQFSGGTSEVARDIGSALNISPIKIDNLVRGYFGSMGSAVLSMGNIILNPNRADRTLNQLPLASVFTLPLTGTRNKDAFYRLREDVMQAVNGAKKLRYNSTDLQQFIDKNGHLMNAEGYIRGKLKTASLIRGQRTQIQEYQGADISSAKKRELLDELDKIELELYADVPSVAAQIRNMSK